MTDSLKLHCLHTIIGSNGANRPGSEPTLAELGVDLKDAETLVASGAARWAEPAAEAPAAAGSPDVILAGVQDADGTVRELSKLLKPELLEIAKGMEIAGCEAMTKPELIEAIQAQEIELVEEPAAAADAEAGAEAPAADAAAAPADENGQA